MVAHQAERIKQLEERLRKMQALLDGKDPPSSTDQSSMVVEDELHADTSLASLPPPVTTAPEVPGGDLVKAVKEEINLCKVLHDWIDKELKINLEPKSEEHSNSLRDLESKFHTEVRMLSEGIVTTFQVCGEGLQ